MRRFRLCLPGGALLLLAAWLAFAQARRNGLPHTAHRPHARCVVHAETAGTFIVPPARAELMYRPEVRGQSRPFVLRVVDKPLAKRN